MSDPPAPPPYPYGGMAGTPPQRSHATLYAWRALHTDPRLTVLAQFNNAAAALALLLSQDSASLSAHLHALSATVRLEGDPREHFAILMPAMLRPVMAALRQRWGHRTLAGHTPLFNTANRHTVSAWRDTSNDQGLSDDARKAISAAVLALQQPGEHLACAIAFQEVSPPGAAMKVLLVLDCVDSEQLHEQQFMDPTRRPEPFYGVLSDFDLRSPIKDDGGNYLTARASFGGEVELTLGFGSIAAVTNLLVQIWQDHRRGTIAVEPTALPALQRWMLAFQPLGSARIRAVQAGELVTPEVIVYTQWAYLATLAVTRGRQRAGVIGLRNAGTSQGAVDALAATYRPVAGDVPPTPDHSTVLLS